ncbi:MAG: hydroxymethylglutaryl-CoA reductase, degradative [Halobacteriovorax sp.]|nr:hydroxymethylglutaryl-CoA reductase, degradative [Halobacteriovorax sp.]|tara:strand:- start:101505 stop:102821 length:1317 start_codon:yes stop_codon:yes gene_type:complete
MKQVSGFSKLSKVEKINYVVKEVLDGSKSTNELIKSYWHDDEEEQKIFDDFSENTLTNFYFPYGVVPNVLMNDELLCVPMVIEESSVVAAAAKAAKFWSSRGGFKTEVISTNKIGQVHFIWHGETSVLENYFEEVKEELIKEVAPLTKNMKSRGGGLIDISLRNKTIDEPGYYQIWAEFNTCDAMGANFINSVLEAIGKKFSDLVENNFDGIESEIQVVMAILSNYTPDCRVKAWVECDIDELEDPGHGMSGREFAEKFSRAVRIAKIDVNRATTHNKGIFNGIDAVVLATGNDFRAVEACGHTWACRDGVYRGLTDVFLEGNRFKFQLELPLSLGTVGGLTSLHPLAKISLDTLGRPSASKLMEIAATLGLAQNFGALRSLTTTGIQKGHMKMHLMNILNHLEASDEERELVKEKFENEIISFQGVREFLAGIRNYQ